MKLARKTKFAVFISVVLLFFACKDESVIEVEILSKAYVDILLVEELYGDNDSLEFKRDEIYKKYSISKNSYDNSFKDFDQNLEEWEIFFKFANTYLDTLKADQKKSVKKKE